MKTQFTPLNLKWLLLAFVCLGFAWSCQHGEALEREALAPDPDVTLGLSSLFPNASRHLSDVVNTNAGRKGKSTHEDVGDFFSGEDVGGSNLLRKSDHVKLNFHANGTDMDIAGHAVTLWFIVFDENGEFVDMKNAAGAVIGENGVINFTNVIVNEGTEGFMFGFGFDDAETQGIGLIARSHGPENPDYMPDMISSFCGGCFESLELGPGFCMTCDGGGADVEPTFGACVAESALPPCTDFAGSFHF